MHPNIPRVYDFFPEGAWLCTIDHCVHDLLHSFFFPCFLSLDDFQSSYSTLSSVYSFTPPGVPTTTLSPALWPSSALPTGDSLEISPAPGLASYEPTMV